jgi:hypothetical protein
MNGYIITVIVIVLLAYLIYYFTQVRDEPYVDPSTGPGPGKDSSGLIITITDQGSKIETYIEMPIDKICSGSKSQPSWCNDITPTTEMNYVYDPVGGDIDDGGNFTTTFNFNTNMCSNGTQDCLYEEKFDSNRKLIGITNAVSEDFIKKLIEDVWTGTIDLNKIIYVTKDDGSREPSGSLKDKIKSLLDFDTSTGVLYFKRDDQRFKIVPGYSSRIGIPNGENEIIVPVGVIILYIIFYCYANDLPEPTIKLDLSSQKTMGEVYHELSDFKASQIIEPTTEES